MESKNKTASKVFMGLFAAFTIVMQAALSRAFIYGLLVEALVHVGFFILFFLAFSLFARNLLKDRVSQKALKIIFGIYISTFIVLMVFLLGFQKYIPAIILGVAYIAIPFWLFFDKGSAKKSAVALLLSLVILGNLTIPGFWFRKIEIAVRESTAELYISEENGYFTHGVAPEKLYIYTPVSTTNGETLFHNSLQAFTTARFSDQIIYESDSTNSAEYTAYHLDTIAKYFPYVEQVRIDSLEELLSIYGSRIENYILYDESSIDSVFVAANLCNQKNAVMLSNSLEYIADTYGWRQVFDATDWTEERFVASEYFDNLDRHLMIMIGGYEDKLYGNEMHMSQFWDLAILNNAWIVNNNFSIVQLEKHLKKLPRNSICIGGIAGCAENAVVQACARYATTFIYTVYTANMSVLTSFDLANAIVDSEVLTDGIINKVEPAKYSDDSTPKHTVCVMLSDGDNVRFCTESLMNPNYYQSEYRDDTLSYNIGLAGSMVQMAPIFLLEFYDDMVPTNDFCYQLSSVGYTYPSKWTDKKAWEQVTKTLTNVMRESQNSVLEIMDDSAFYGVLDIPSNFGSLRKYFDTYTCYDEVDGCLFIDYTALYSGYRGAICWSNDKPVVSAKYSVWYDEGTPYNSKRNEIDYICKEINEMSTDKTSEDAYTFIIVHGWSGLDENGKLVRFVLSSESDSDNTAIFKALSDGFDEDVEMVTTTEFINRMRRCVKR